MHILCPHCRNPIEVVKLTPREEVACPSCGSSFCLEAGTTTGWERAAGQKLGRFEVIDAVGQGAFGTVYKARDPELDRAVALKVPRAGNLTGPQELDRFLREARSVAQLRHPSIVAVHEVGQSEGVPYLVSDFVEGVTLADLLSGRRPGFREAADLVAVLADALHFAHERGVVHRDVKPSNVMIGPDGRPVVMDFGMAKREAGEVTMTVEGQVLGTPAYMSPEQARGDAHRVDGRSDVYSLGVILYELLTGELPFRGTKRMLLHQVLHDDPRPPRALNDRIPRDLETVCLRAMAKEPQRRYGTAKDLAHDLQRWLNGEAVHARPVGRLDRAARRARRHPAAAGLVAVSGLAALALVGLAVGIVYSAWLNDAYQSEAAAHQSEAAARAEAVAARQAEEEQRKKAEAALDTADRIAYVHSIFLADAALKDNNLALARIRLKECEAKGPGWEWHFLNGQAHPELFSFRGLGGVVFSPDGTQVAGVDGDTLRVYDVRTGREALTINQATEGSGVAFSPDGSRLAVRGKEATALYEARTGRELLSLKGPTVGVLLRFNPDGSRLATCDIDLTVRVYDTLTGNQVFTRTVPGSQPLMSVTFSPDGSKLAVESPLGLGLIPRIIDAQTGEDVPGLEVAKTDGVVKVLSPDLSRVAALNRAGLRVYALKTGQTIYEVKIVPPVLLSPVVFSPDGARLAAWGPDLTVRIYDLTTGKEVSTARGRPHGPWPLAFSPDGLFLAAALADGVVRVHDVQTGKEVFALKAPALLDSPVFSPDGVRVAARGGDNVIRVFDARTNSRTLTGKAPRFGTRALNFSPDGRQIVTLSGDGWVRVHDVLTRREVSAFKADLAPPLSASFTPEGSRILLRDGAGGARLYDARTGRELLALGGRGPGFASPSLSPDGSRIALADAQGVVRAFDSRTGQELLVIRGAKKLSMPTFSPDGTRIAAFAMGSWVHLYDAATAQERVAFRSPDTCLDLVYSRNGTRIALGFPGSADGTAVRIYDTRTGEQTLAISGPQLPFAAGALAFNPDDSRIAATGSDGVLRIYDAQTGGEVLAIKDLALKDLSQVMVPAISADWAHIASDEGGMVRLWECPRDMEDYRRRKRERLEAGVLAWHQDQAAESEKAGRWFAAAFHLRWLIQAEPQDGVLYRRRGGVLKALGRMAEANQDFEKALTLKDRLSELEQAETHAELSQWDAAARLYARAAEAPDAPHWVYTRNTLLRLQQGDRAGYSRACAALVERFGKTQDVGFANGIAWKCAVGPEALTDLTPAVELARWAVAASPKNHAVRNTFGAILHRAKQDKEAVAELNEAIKLHPEGGHPIDFFFLAMAHHRLGQNDEAKQWLEKGVQAAEKASPTEWEDRLELQLIRREAEQLIQKKPPE